MKKHWNLSIKGKVQGVFYRKHTNEKAHALGLTGWVKNERDGSVSAAVEGDEEVLKQFVSWCKQGPPNAEVKHVDVEEGSLQHYTTFEIIR